MAFIVLQFATAATAQQAAQNQFGGTYDQLNPRQRALVDDWFARFERATGHDIDARTFYDNSVWLSAKTTLDAVTHALITTTLTDREGQSLGDALALVQQIETVRGKWQDARSDQQFRMYVVLTENAVDILERSREFARGADNFVYHRGYPINFRQQGGIPSIQISIARDRRRADIDVDYRLATFPLSLINGHLTSSNSDVRAGGNYKRHAQRWFGFTNWWRNLFGVRLPNQDYVYADPGLRMPSSPRAGRKNLDEMAFDFLNAWLVEGNVMAAIGYVSAHAYACVEDDVETPVDRGVAQFVLLARMKAVHERLGSRASLEGITTGVRLTRPDLKVVDHAHHAQFVLYSMPNDVADAFDCESRTRPGNVKTRSRQYGTFYGSTFLINDPLGKSYPIALLWAKEDGFWKIVSWEADPNSEGLPDRFTPPRVTVTRVEAERSLVDASRDFLESWMIRRDYDRAFGYLSQKSYACYNLTKDLDAPTAASAEEAGRFIRRGMERAATLIGPRQTLVGLLTALEPVHPDARLMNHRWSATFSLSTPPNAIVDWFDCAKRASGEPFPSAVPVQYGLGYGMYFRMITLAGEAPVFRVLWIKEGGKWRIGAYDVETP